MRRHHNHLEELVAERTRELATLNQALKKSEERFRFLVQQVKDYAIVYLDTEGCIVSWNEGAEQIYRCPCDEVLGKHLSVFHPKEGIEQRDPWRMLEAATTEGQFKGVGWRVRGDGSRFWADVVITALRNESGALQGFAVVTRNIDERRKAEEALSYRLAMEELVIGISNRFINVPPEALEDEIGRALEVVRDFTSAHRSYLCLLSEGLSVTSFFESLSEKTGSRAPKLEALSLESLPWLLGELKRGEAVALSDTSDLPPEATAERKFWRSVSPVRALLVIPVNIGTSLRGYLALNSDERGKTWAPEDVKLLRIVGQIFGASLERRQSEERHRDLELKILESRRREVEMRQRENDRWIALGHMASGIAHDIRNPINFVSLALEYLSEKKQGGQKEKSKARELFTDAHTELLRVNDMIQGLLDFGRVQTLNLQVENASEVLTQSRDEVIRRHHGQKLHLTLEGADSRFPIYVDHGLLTRALVNLFENALEAGGPAGPVRGGVSRRNGDAVLWLEDSGPGIEAENLGKIFSPYFTTKKAGIGLGLTLTRKWVDGMGGRITVVNVPTGGARFELSFPIVAVASRGKRKRVSESRHGP